MFCFGGLCPGSDISLLSKVHSAPPTPMAIECFSKYVFVKHQARKAAGPDFPRSWRQWHMNWCAESRVLSQLRQEAGPSLQVYTGSGLDWTSSVYWPCSLGSALGSENPLWGLTGAMVDACTKYTVGMDKLQDGGLGEIGTQQVKFIQEKASLTKAEACVGGASPSGGVRSSS